jgi:formate--tetrahydrofolate ligase
VINESRKYCFSVGLRRALVKTDIEIARETKLKPIEEIAAKLGISYDDIEFYGKYKAKITNYNPHAVVS